MFNGKLGLVLGSGGARGFCHIGVIKVLEEYGIKPDIIVGSSMGAVVGGFYAAGIPVSKMISISKNVNQFTVMDFDILPRKRLGLVNGKRASALFRKYLGEVKIEDLPIKYAAVAVDINTGETNLITQGDVWKAMRASMSIPGVFKPFSYNGKLYIDGGVLHRLPIKQAYDMGADKVIAVDAVGPFRVDEKPKGFIGVVERTFALMDWKNSQTILKDCDYLITPDMGSKNEFIFKNNEEAIIAGEEAAYCNINNILKILKE